MAAGSTSPCSSRTGSTPPATMGAAISSPPARTTPLTAPPAEVTDTTSADTRSSAPATRAAAGERVGDGPGPTLGDDGLARGPAVVARRIGQQDGGGAGRPGPHGGEQDAARRQRGPQGLVREALPDEIGHGHGERAQQVAAVVATQPAVAHAEPQPGQRVAGRWRAHVGRRGGGEAAQEAGQRAHATVELRVRRGVRRRTGLELRGGARGIRPQGQRAAVRLRREDPRLGLHEGQAVALQAEVAVDVGAQPPDRVGQRRHAHAGDQLVGDGGPAEAVAPLQEQRAQPGAGQVRGGRQAVVAAADDDGVPGPGGDAHHAARRPGARYARRISCAARRPGAPMMPPPGWVAEPPSHRSRTGVR